MENKKIIWGIGISIIILLIIGGIFLVKPTGSAIEKDNEVNKKIIVSSVIDGDTIKLSTSEEVRLIGINAPEEGEKCYEEAKEYLEEWVLGKEVILEKDIEDKDQYGRLLRYIFIDNYNINQKMVLNGLAHKQLYGSNTKYSSLFEEAENIAKENCGCIWQPCLTNNNKEDEEKKEIADYIEDKCFVIIKFHFDAEGNDNYNLNDEYVSIKNTCDYSINMNNWTIKDETASHIYYFPDFSIEGENFITLYTGIGENKFTFEGDKLYWGREEGNYGAIWNNNGDTLFLRDAQENLVLTKGY